MPSKLHEQHCTWCSHITAQVVFAPCMEGRDLIGRAKTGSGKTLAFALPIVEGLLEANGSIQCT
eukprot:1158892-Pelagomonas_calceolata.AAC.16